ncbi:MAG: phenyltransferase domain-containing protein [Desulfobacterales bacterium]
MKQSPLKSKNELAVDVFSVSSVIAKTQKKNGEIPWAEGEKTDPWDHVEAAMGLTIGGHYEASRQAFFWLRDNQLSDGSWYASYRNGEPDDRTHDTNMSSYIAVGLLHYFLVTGDWPFIREMWDTLERGITFALSLQTPEGEIYWAKNPTGRTDPIALLTGSSSVYMSVKCALVLSGLLGYQRPQWRTALHKLGDAIRHKPHLFNMTKSRFSMDWFYPILAGAVTGAEAQRRIKKYWRKFVFEDQGVRCVSDQPWVTVAETSELCLALSAMGNTNLAGIVFNWIQNRTFDDNSFWCGFTCPDITVWPEDKMTWTNAVVLMAADALYELTPGGKLFNHRFWETSIFSRFL